MLAELYQRVKRFNWERGNRSGGEGKGKREQEWRGGEGKEEIMESGGESGNRIGVER